MRVFDLHCDTPYALYHSSSALTENEGHISLARASVFSEYAQVMAIWSDNTLSDEEAWEQFFKISADFRSKIPDSAACLCRTAKEIHETLAEKKIPLLLMVEGARLLAGDLDRLDVLWDAGVRLLTLTWRDTDCIGGAYNTDAPLTPFGRAVVEKCFARGMIVDLSHASCAVADEVLAMAEQAGAPVVATHANSFAVCAHPRNLTDDRARKIAALGGLVGISLAPQHLIRNGDAYVFEVCHHILHGLSVGLAGAMALGCDFDGIEKTPRGLRNLSELPNLDEALSKWNIDAKTRDDLFFGNVMRFFDAHL